jgi:hypothetical protein
MTARAQACRDALNAAIVGADPTLVAALRAAAPFVPPMDDPADYIAAVNAATVAAFDRLIAAQREDLDALADVTAEITGRLAFSTMTTADTIN